MTRLLLPLFVVAGGCAQSVTDVWEDYDHALYASQEDVDATCEGAMGTRHIDGSWSMEAGRDHELWLSGYNNEIIENLSCVTRDDGCTWDLARGDVLILEPLQLQINCSERTVIGELSLAGDIRGRALEYHTFYGAIE